MWEDLDALEAAELGVCTTDQLYATGAANGECCLADRE